MKVDFYHTSGPVSGLCKQSAIWVRDSKVPAGYTPLVYLQRPKWITDDEAWNKIVSSVQLKLPKGYEVT